MKCDKCFTEVRFTNDNILFFHTPEGYKPCKECKDKFSKIRDWTNKLPVQLNLQIVNEFNESVRGLNAMFAVLDNMKPKKVKSIWYWLKKKFFSM